MYYENRLVAPVKVTHGQKTRTPAKPLPLPLGSALPVLPNLKLHGDQPRENTVPFERVKPLICFCFVPSFYPMLWEFVVPNVIWIDSYNGILKPQSDVFLCKQNSQVKS